MRKIPDELREDMANDPYYKKCARHKDGGCSSDITWEHCIIYGGRQLNEKWAIIPLCSFHHSVNLYQDGGDLQKDKNVHIALNRASTEQLDAISKAVDYIAMRDRLNRFYG